MNYPANLYLFKANNRNITKILNMFKTIKTPERS